MPYSAVGVSDLSLYVPGPVMSVKELAEIRVKENPELEEHMERALKATDQRAIRYPRIWEDTATFGAEAVKILLDRGADPAAVRHLVSGTETAVDHSKPTSAYVMGMLQRAGYGLGPRLTTYQIQHACAGGTLAALDISAFLMASGRKDGTGIAFCTDIARYDRASTAEVTQGSGAVGILLENSPKLLELDLATVGYSSEDVDDFFRPLGSTTAKVRGGYSIKCYNQALLTSWEDHARQKGLTNAELLAETDYYVLHTPFKKMPL